MHDLNQIEAAAKCVATDDRQNRVCVHCGLPIYYDLASGYWFHAGHDKVDGRNGLHCSPEMWESGATRVYAFPSPLVPITEATVLALVEVVKAARNLMAELGASPIPGDYLGEYADLKAALGAFGDE